MFIGKGLEALDWDTSEAAGWLRVEADGGGSWLVPPQALKPFFQQNLWYLWSFLIYLKIEVCFIFEWSCILLDDVDDKWWTMKDDREMMNHERWMMDDDDDDVDDDDDDVDDDGDDDDDAGDDGDADCDGDSDDVDDVDYVDDSELGSGYW